MIRLVVLAILLLWPLSASAQSFPAGQWSTFGTGYYQNLWRAPNPPVDPYRTLANGTVMLPGQTLKEALSTANHDGIWAFTAGCVFDTDREREICTQADGHAASGTNEVLEFIASSGAWSQSMLPTVELFSPQSVTWPNCPGVLCIPYAGIHTTGPLGLVDVNNHYPTNVDPDTGGGGNVYPNTTQQYGNITYIPSPYNQFWTCGGVAAWDPSFGTSRIFTYNVVTKKWQMQGADTTFGSGSIGCSGFPGGATWDSTYHRVLFWDWNNVYQYDPALSPGSRVSIVVNGGTSSSNDENTAMWDPVRKRALFFAGGIISNNQVRVYDFSGGPTSPVATTQTITGYTFAHGFVQGWLYDSRRDKYVFIPFDGTNTIVTVDPATWAATVSVPGGATLPSQRATEHLGSRFFYVPSAGVYMALLNATDSTAFVFNPGPVSAPTLAFLDLTQGNRTGSVDTSHGQTVGADGVIVTVWGHNLGSSQGASTLTIGGVAPRAVYYWGNATAPNCGGANLFNDYQKLQCVIFQISGSTPTGAQNIVATIGGVTTNALSFQVNTTGNIYFAGPSSVCGSFTGTHSSIQAMLNAMDRLDVGYACAGSSVSGGVSLPTPNTRFDHTPTSNPLAIVAYPLAAIQMGDATHTGFQLGFSGTGYGVTYAKFTAYSNNQDGAFNFRDDVRVVGNFITMPNGNSGSGTGCVGALGSNLFLLGNEFTNCGASGAGNTLDHVVYFGGRRNPCPCFLESVREAGWNYIHDNNMLRAFNLFNDSGAPDSNPISDHNIHDNVVLNQQGSAVLFGRGVVGNNSFTNNIVMNAGLTSQYPGGTGWPCIDVQMSEADGGGASVPHDPTVVTVSSNTVMNCGESQGSNANNGVMSYGGASVFYKGTITFKDNVFFQNSVAFPYEQATGAINGTTAIRNGSNNLWFGSGAAPTFDTSPVNSTPLLVNGTTAPYDLHLQSGSLARNAGLVLTTPSLDFDGVARPTSGSWDIGALQFGLTPGGGISVTGTIRFTAPARIN